ncbi:helix-turn-helix transcriptional regulator [Paenibacillus piri]|uniref:AraC family transcriptional regulator n=1 Tax=Paenibacillus piri TaxID=2547395 RepID=A0A4R5KKG2_9BACL|nr:AraC family transcriptional regulator [Paenibacillus piri]TDF94860.1 AraC family transcriptional regulator [Paenibacillus piri]
MQEYSGEFAEFWYNVPTALEKAGALWLVRSGRNIAKPGYAVGPKVIDCYGFHFIMEGKVRLEYNGESQLLQKNDLFCLMPHISYYYRMAPSVQSLRMVWITLDGGQLPELLARIGLNAGVPYIRGAIGRSVRRALAHLVAGSSAGAAADPLLRQSELLRLFALLGGAASAGRPKLATQPLTPQDGEAAAGVDEAEPRRRQQAKQLPSRWLAEAVAYIRLHYTEPLSIAELAATAGVHRSHYSSMFAKEAGYSPQRLILRLRMEKAVSLLAADTLTITETALSVGYPDVYSFSRAFKKYYGKPPSDWRGMRQQS